MLTARGTGMLVAAFALWLASRAFGIAELQMAAVGAVALVVAGFLFTRTISTQLHVSRTVRPGRLAAGQTGTVELHVTNIRSLPAVGLELADRAPATIADAGRVPIRLLAPGRRATITYRVRGDQRGRFEVGPLTVRVRDPFGLVGREQVLPGSTDVVIYPKVWALPDGIPFGGTTTSGGGGRPRPLPSGEELANVREYVRGDDLRTVHWPTTAHRGRLMVRQAESPQDPRAVVLLDIRAAAHAGHGPTASIETAVSTAASAVQHLERRGRSVVLLDRPVTVPPRALPSDRWLARLAEVTIAPVDLAALLRQVAQGIAGGGALVAVVTTPRADELRELVRAGRGFTTRVAVLVDAASHAGRRPAPDQDATVAALRAAGWRVTVMRAGDRLDERWRELVLHRRDAARVS